MESTAELQYVAAFLVQGIERSPSETGYMQPIQPPIHLCARLICMEYSLLPQASFQVVLKRLKASEAELMLSATVPSLMDAPNSASVI